MATPTPLILGLAGPVLTDAERDYIAAQPPAGFLIFARNIEAPDQIRALCAELVALSAFETPFIAVDQEGGRVQRLAFAGRNPPAKVFGDWYAHNPAAAREACELNALLLAAQVRSAGATWVMGPVLDLSLPQTHAVIGDRAFAADPAVVADLGLAFLRGVARGGCMGCIKHAPGHGRATADSHHELPVVDAPLAELAADFAPFKAVAPHCPFMMTAHIRYPQLDVEAPATTSGPLLEMMRREWGFHGLIMADDVGMQALDGTYVSRIERAVGAGCDLAIASLSVLRHGMAGTVFDEAHFAELQAASLPPLNPHARNAMESVRLPEAATPDDIALATRTLKALWADGPGRVGYDLAL